MKKKISLAIILATIWMGANAQWTVGAGLGISLPITGYSEVVKPGMTIFNLHAKRSLGSGNLAIGAITQMSRFAEDNDPMDSFYDAKLTVAPVIFTLDYTINVSGKLQPYVSGGIGLSFYSFSYNSSPTTIDDQSVFNVSFSMMPLIGLRYKVSEHLSPFLETGFNLVMDGPPVGFPEGNKITGYQFISLGLQYAF